MTPPLLSAALIVRDEADHLRRCLASIRALVDEIVVVDTGSTDESPEVARSFGAVLGSFPWNGNFADARNHALGLATGRWILYVDADEELAPTDVAAVRAALADGDACVAFLPLLRARSDWTPFREYRVFRNRPDIRFRGTIHETMVPDLLRVAHDEGLGTGWLDCLIVHHGYEGDQTHKHHRNLPLLEEQVENDPTRVYLWDHLGRIHEALGHEAEARAAWWHGIGIIRALGPQVPADCLAYFDLVLHLTETGEPERVEEAADLADEADEQFPGNALVLWAGATAAMEAGRYERAERRLIALLTESREAAAADAMALNERVFEDVGWHALGVCRYQLADFVGAAEAFQNALDRFETPEYRAKLAASRLRAGLLRR